MKNTDVHHITIAGVNPHHITSAMGEKGNPFYDEIGRPSVAQHIIENDKIVGGIVSVWTQEHLTPAQERYLQSNPHVIDVRHVYPESDEEY